MSGNPLNGPFSIANFVEVYHRPTIFLVQDGPGAVAFKGDADVRGGVVSGEVRLRRAGNEATAGHSMAGHPMK